MLVLTFLMDFARDRELAYLFRKEIALRARFRKREYQHHVVSPPQISAEQFVLDFQRISAERRAVIERYRELSKGLDVPEVPDPWEWPVS